MKHTFISMLGVALIFAACTGRTEAPVTATPAAEENAGFKMITAKISIRPEHIADFIEVATVLIDSSNMEAGCISYQLYQDPYDQTKFIFVEEWVDQAAIDNHNTMTYFLAAMPKVEAWQSAPTELKIIDAVLNQ